jgi:tetratricopeptide (TPR) repeat protein
VGPSGRVEAFALPRESAVSSARALEPATGACATSTETDEQAVDPEAIRARALEAFTSERFDEALEAFRELVAALPEDVGAAFGVAYALRKLGRLDEARSAIDEALALAPAVPLLLAERAWVEYDDDRFDDALTWFGRALEADPANADALEWKVTCLRRLRRFEEALAAADEALALRPGEVRLLNERAWVDHDQQLYGDALEWFGRALEADPADPAALEFTVTCLRRLRRFEEARAAADDALARRPGEPRLLVERAFIEYDEDRYDDALDWFGRVLDADPANADALRWRVACLRLARRFDEARTAADEALALRPGEFRLLNERALVESDDDRYDAALTWFERALAVDAGDAGALVGRIQSLRFLKRFPEALEAYEGADPGRRGEPALLNQRAWLDYDQDRFDDAVTWFDRALEADPANADALRWKVACLRRARRFEEAHAAADEALAQRPGVAPVLNERGFIEYDQGRFDDGLAWFERSLRADPADATALEWRVTCLRRSRRFDDARVAADEALARRPGEARLLTERGWVESDRGDFAPAVEWFAQAVAADATSSTAGVLWVMCLRSLGRFDEAEEAFLASSAGRPDDADLLVERGWVEADRGRRDAALEWFDRAVTADGRNVGVRGSRGRLLRLNGRLDQARAALSAAREELGDDPALLVEAGWVEFDAGTYDAALGLFDQALAQAWSADTVAAYAWVQRSARRRVEALATIEAALERAPESTELWRELVWIRISQDLPVEAQAAVERLAALADGPGIATERGGVAFAREDYAAAEHWFGMLPLRDDVERTNLAWSLVRQQPEDTRLEQEKLARADELCRSALKLNPRALSALSCLGVIAFRRGRLQEAERYLQQTIEVDEANGSHTDLGALYAQMARYDDALRCLTRAVELDWYDAKAHVEMGGVHLLQGRPAEALDSFRQGAKANPLEEKALLGQAFSLGRLGRDQEAEQVLRSGLRSIPPDQQFPLRLHLAQLLIERGDRLESAHMYEEALAEAQHAVRLQPNDPEGAYVQGVAFHRIAQQQTAPMARSVHVARARRQLERCVRLAPDHVSANRDLRVIEIRREEARKSYTGSIAVAVLAIALLVLIWVAFLVSDEVTEAIVLTMTPILVGLVVVAFLLPYLTSLKMPGLEATVAQRTEELFTGPLGVDLGASDRQAPLGSGPG